MIISSPNIPGNIFRFSRDILGKEVADCAGFRPGRVRDLAIRLDGDPGVQGVVVGKRFFPWSTIGGMGRELQLSKRLFSLAYEPFPSDCVLASHAVLGERLLDSHGRTLGRVTDLQLAYDASSNRLQAKSITALTLNQKQLRIPWSALARISTKPGGVTIRYSIHQLASLSQREKLLA